MHVAGWKASGGPSTATGKGRWARHPMCAHVVVCNARSHHQPLRRFGPPSGLISFCLSLSTEQGSIVGHRILQMTFVSDPCSSPSTPLSLSSRIEYSQHDHRGRQADRQDLPSPDPLCQSPKSPHLSLIFLVLNFSLSPSSVFSLLPPAF
jgi:hypothetical protein